VSSKPKKKRTAFDVILWILGAVVMLGAFFAVAALVVFARSDTGRKTFGILGEVNDAQKAPGTRELRKLGCNSATVMDSLKMEALLRDDASPGAGTGEHWLIVSCQGGFLKKPPTCDEVADTYVRAVGKAAAPMLVAVTSPKDPGGGCRRRYSPEGLGLGPASFDGDAGP